MFRSEDGGGLTPFMDSPDINGLNMASPKWKLMLDLSA
jgi:hypothetical protein